MGVAFEHAADVERIRRGQLSGPEAAAVLRQAIAEKGRAEDAAGEYGIAIEAAEEALIYGPAGRPRS